LGVCHYLIPESVDIMFQYLNLLVQVQHQA